MMNSKEPLVSVLVLNFNGINHLKECFDSLLELNYKNVELILIDNNSIDNSVEFIRNTYPTVKIFQLPENLGFTIANNIGASQAKGAYITLLNNDTVVDKNWLTELVKVAQKSKKNGIIASKIYYYSNRKIIDYAGSSCDKFLKTNHLGRNLKDNKLLNIENETFYACGAALMIKKELYNKIGLFDPLYFIYSEDFDLCWRAWIFGYKVIYAPKSFIYHKIGQVIQKESLRKKFLNERNRLRTLLKNYEFKSIIWILPIYFIKRIGMFFKLVLHLDNYALIYIIGNINAIIWNLIHLKSLMKNRKFIQTNRKKNDRVIFGLMNKTKRLENLINEKKI